MPDLKTKALQLNIEGLFKLLGGTAAERERFWEIRKGITSVVEFAVINRQLESMAVLVKQVELGAKALKPTAGKMAKS